MKLDKSHAHVIRCGHGSKGKADNLYCLQLPSTEASHVRPTLHAFAPITSVGGFIFIKGDGI